jgi:hypothetical protein
MPFAASIALAISFALNGGVAAPASIMPTAQTAQQYVESYFSDIPVMIDIARCESHFRQYDEKGNVHRGEVNNLDVGIMQVNEYYHSATAEKLGLDLYTMQGNVSYARYLYEKEGTAPWNSSKPCWGKAQAKLVANR